MLEAGPSLPSSIKYTKTRTVKLDPALLSERRVIAGSFNNPQASIFRILRTKVLQRLRDNKWNTLAITSPMPGAGKSFISVNLAIALALELNQTVLLVDTDLRRPKVSWYFGIEPEFGLLDYLQKAVPPNPPENRLGLEDVLINPGINRLVILPGKGTTNHSSELLSSPTMQELVSDLKSRYESRIILFDMPPLLITDDTLLFMSQFDAALMVVEDGNNSPDELRRSVQLLEGTKLLGTVLNKSRKAELNLSYGY